jgi:hypothetical protein
MPISSPAIAVLLAGAVSVSVCACGGTTSSGSTGAGDVVSCTISSQAGSFSFTECLEETGLTPEQISATQTACTMGFDAGAPMGDSGQSVSITGMFAYGPCTHAGSLGGCKITVGSFTQTIWYYGNGMQGQTMHDVQTACAQQNGVYIIP